MSVQEFVAQYGLLLGATLYLVWITWRSMVAGTNARTEAQTVINKEREIIADMLEKRDADYHNLLVKFDTQRTKTEQLEAEFALYRASADDEQATREQIIRELREDLKRSDEERATLEAKFADVQAQLDKLTQQNETKENERIALTARLDDEIRRNEKLQRELRDVEQKLYTMQGETNIARLVLEELRSIKQPVAAAAPPLIVHEANSHIEKVGEKT